MTSIGRAPYVDLAGVVHLREEVGGSVPPHPAVGVEGALATLHAVAPCHSAVERGEQHGAGFRDGPSGHHGARDDVLWIAWVDVGDHLDVHELFASGGGAHENVSTHRDGRTLRPLRERNYW